VKILIFSTEYISQVRKGRMAISSFTGLDTSYTMATE